jgi:hypothetical protein
MRPVLLLLSCLMPMTALAESAGSETSYAGMHVVLPDVSEGWERKEARDGLILQKIIPEDKARNRGRGAVMIQIGAPKPGGALPAAFDVFVKSMDQLKSERSLTKAEGVSINRHPMLMQLHCCSARNGADLSVVSVGVAAPQGNIFLRLVMIQIDRLERKSYEDRFAAIVRSLRPSNRDKAFGLTPPGPTDSLKGIFTHQTTGIRPNVFGGTDFYAESRILAFDGRGIFSTEIPSKGRDLTQHCATEPTSCGYYTLKSGGVFGGGRIEMQEATNMYGMFDRKEEPFAISGQNIRIGETTHTRIPPLKAGTRFTGRWRDFQASSGTTPTSSGNVVRERFLVLHGDGRYERSGYSGASSTIGGTGVTVGGQRPSETGRYEIDGHRITFMASDGPASTMSLFQPDASSDRLLIIDGANYLKQNEKR